MCQDSDCTSRTYKNEFPSFFRQIYIEDSADTDSKFDNLCVLPSVFVKMVLTVENHYSK